MKKLILFLFALSIIVTYSMNKSDEVIIPNNAIRFRIIANSNSFDDQTNKNQLKKAIMDYFISEKIEYMSKDEVIHELKNNQEPLQNIIKEYTDTYQINYGYNYFPTKNYQGIKYEAGNYESLVITIGEGLGDNWWCVLYPPLCFVDENTDNYHSIVKEIIDKF